LGHYPSNCPCATSTALCRQQPEPSDNRPRHIGRLGTKLGDSKVNIATFHLGRPEPGAEAVLLVSVDQNVTPAVLGKIAKLESVVKVRLLKFAA
jgi:D-3-phosphoglycerate dehydrogenase